MLKWIGLAIIGLVGSFLILHTIIRIIRYYYKFPMPEFAANIIDNPIRRRIQPPDVMPARHGIQPGMQVLEVGPGNGTYTLASARAIGDAGALITIDIEPKMIDRVNKRILQEGVQNIDARVGDVFDLPFDDGFFDLVYMIAVIGEIPTPVKAFHEFYRVLSAEGKLAFSELLMDPDYPRAETLINLARSAGFKLEHKEGSFFAYTLRFEKDNKGRK
jgi:ubiquinone/menaquinone biosynthesis C-methylase UbiE